MKHRTTEAALRAAIAFAKAGSSETVKKDDVLLGCLWALSRFGVAQVGRWAIDLEPLGVDRKGPPASPGSKPGYSSAVVEALDMAADWAAHEGGAIEIAHVLACFADEPLGLMAQLRRDYGVTSLEWRAALAAMPSTQTESNSASSPAAPNRPYLTPEEGAAYLGVHIQTIRGYIRQGKLSALRIAGERAIRLRREDLDALLEPLQPQDFDKPT